MTKGPEVENPKRFWLFAWEVYDASGGLGDLEDWFDTEAEALDAASAFVTEKMVEIIDTKTGRYVEFP